MITTPCERATSAIRSRRAVGRVAVVGLSSVGTKYKARGRSALQHSRSASVVGGGAQVVLAAVLAAILKPGDALCVPALTYPGLRMARRSAVGHVSGAVLVLHAIEEARRTGKPR
jgi:hypothetical protein